MIQLPSMLLQRTQFESQAEQAEEPPTEKVRFEQGRQLELLKPYPALQPVQLPVDALQPVQPMQEEQKPEPPREKEILGQLLQR